LASRYFQHKLPGGMTLLGESMSGVQSAAMSLMLPAGAAGDPDDARGAATVLSDLALRGAGNRDSRQLIDYLDSLGLQRGSGAGIYHAHYSCAGVGPRVIEALAAYADIVRRPKMPETGFEAARDLALQALAGVGDDPRQKLVIALREHHFPAPLGRNPMGDVEDLQNLTLDRCRTEHKRRYRGGDAILALAGNIDFDVIRREVEKQFGDFNGAAPQTKLKPAAKAHSHFEHQQSEQTHIGIAYNAIPFTDPDYYVMRVAMEVLGGGMSGRLFTELREKRALVYNVWAGYSGLKDLGAILGYAGTSNDRAQATLDCFIAELHRLSQGVTSAEVERARIGLKATTIMEGESTGSRAGSLAHDYFMHGRIRTLEEIKTAIDAVTVEKVNAYLQTHTPGPFTVVIVGPRNLKMPE
jgi:predicted Zn-dependent peptidase